MKLEDLYSSTWSIGNGNHLPCGELPEHYQGDPYMKYSNFEREEHFYDDSVMGEKPSTHYVVAGYHLKVHQNRLALPIGDQHNEYKWCEKSKVKSDKSIHKHSSDYMDAVLSIGLSEEL